VNFLLVIKLDSPSLVENSASARLDLGCEESDVFQQDVNAKEKYEGEQML